MSIEALAMAGADYMECDINIEALERCGSEQPPPYLLADQQYLSIEVHRKGDDKKSVDNGEVVKAKMREWAKAVASKKNALQFEIF